MPTIPTERVKRQVRVNPWVLLGIMSFPKDEEQRRLHLASAHRHVMGEMEAHIRDLPEARGYSPGQLIGAYFGKVLEAIGGFRALSQAPSVSEARTQVEERVWPASIAGDILNYLIQMRAAGLGVSVNKAVALSEEYLKGATTRKGPPGGRSDRYIRQAWEDFKPVCHLWAAFRLLEESDIEPADRVEARLPLSRALLGLALTLQPKGRREPLLRAEEMWQLPRRYKSPHAPIRFTIPPLEEWQMEVLRSKFKSLRE